LEEVIDGYEIEIALETTTEADKFDLNKQLTEQINPELTRIKEELAAITAELTEK